MDQLAVTSLYGDFVVENEGEPSPLFASAGWDDDKAFHAALSFANGVDLEPPSGLFTEYVTIAPRISNNNVDAQSPTRRSN